MDSGLNKAPNAADGKHNRPTPPGQARARRIVLQLHKKYASLESKLSSEIDSGALLLSIDGFGGTGKTCVADRLGRALGIHVTHLDHFLVNGRANILGGLGRDGFCEELTTLARKPSIVEGGCIEAALELVEHPPDVTTYVMVCQSGDWTDGVHIPKKLTVAELTSNHQIEVEVAKRMPSSPPRVFDPSDIVPIFAETGIYHHDYEPHVRADYGYLRDLVLGHG